MLNVENLQIGDNSYVIRDANTYRSLTSTQETQLRATGTYNGEAVENGEVFTKEDGTFQEFVKTHHLPDGYIDTNTTIASVYQSSALATTYNNIEMVVRGPSSDGYVEYSENGGFTWRRSSLVVDGVPQDFYVDVNISFSICKGATSADVFIVRSGAYQYASTCYLSTDGGKTFEEKGNQAGDSRGIFLGYLKSAGKLFYAKDSSMYNPYYSIDNGATWNKIESWDYGRNYGQLDDDTFILTNGTDVYTTQDLETFIQIGSGCPLYTQGTWFNLIRRCGNYLVSRSWNNGDRLFYSTNGGVSWNSTPIATTHGACLDYDNGTYISFDASGYVYTSEDLLSGWTQSNFFSFSDSWNNTNAQPVVHAQNKFVFSSASGSAVVPYAPYDTYDLEQLSYSKDEAQGKLTVGTGIEISAENVISAALRDIAGAGAGIKFTKENSNAENFVNVGSLTISNGIANGFAQNKYLKMSEVFPANADSWEFVIGGTHVSQGGNVRLIGNCDNTTHSQIMLGNNYNKMYLWLSSNGTSWDIADEVEGTSTFNDTDLHYFKLVFTGSSYILYSSPDLTTWTQELSITSSTKVFNSDEPLWFGNNAQINWYGGYFYLKDCYLIADNSYYWLPYYTKAKILAPQMNGATALAAGSSGIVPAPSAGDNSKFLRGDGTWQSIGGISKYTANNTALTSVSDVCTWTVTHNLGTKDVVVAVYDLTTGTEPIYNATHSTTNQVVIDIQSSVNIAADSYRVVILG